ncbi:Methionine synthase [Geodia barretti]|uniref:methionine synthase n=1 Tax=Geodia barretti TaxID=519541 RepID=A0AA35SIK0_GEOBA|nr:Methionine synthase [Geodia barretti]
MGTQIQARDLGPDDFGGEEYEGCNEYLNITRPDVIHDIHRGYLDAGADIIQTNTFGATALVLGEYSLAPEARRINREAAGIARRAADEATAADPDKPRFVYGAMGPTTRTISVTGGLTFDELAADYHQQAAGLIEGGADVLVLETGQDTINIKAGLEGIDRARAEMNVDVPAAVQGTVEPMGTLLAGQDAEAFYTSLAHRNLLWVGFNCATGPEFMTDHIRTLNELSRFGIACVPNAETRVSGIEAVVVNEDTRPTIVGERTNVLGSRRFKRLIAGERFEEAAEVGRRQVRNGAHILDVCLQDPDRDETSDVVKFLDQLNRRVKAPIMIDSTDASVIEESLKRLQGKSIINSINLEDGEERFQRVVPLARDDTARGAGGGLHTTTPTRHRRSRDGLDMAIVNSEMMQRYASIPEEERTLSEDLIWNRGCGAGTDRGLPEHQPDIIGLSGLLVKSAQMMVETVQDFRAAGIARAPVLVGGAALSNRFTRLRIAPEYGGLVAYSPDAMSGLARGQYHPGRR